MSKELEFPWKYFMDTGLRYIDKEHSSIDTVLESIHRTFTSESLKICGNTGHTSFAENCIPFAVNPKNLSDEDWMYIFYGDGDSSRRQIQRDCMEIRIVNKEFPPNVYNRYSIVSGALMNCNQQILNRFYEKHSIPNYEKLLNAEIIIDAGDVYKQII